MLKNTKGIVLRNVKYGDTSLVVTIYTEWFGVQTYLVQGVRSEKKSMNKASLYQPSHILDLEVFHQPGKNLQRIQEARIFYWYQTTYLSVIKNSVSIFCTELFSKIIIEPESNEELYHFLADTLQYIDQHAEKELANLPIYFALQLAEYVGFGIQEMYSTETPFLDLINGQFVSMEKLQGLEYVQGDIAENMSKIQLSERNQLINIALPHTQRNEILQCVLRYLQIHIPNMSLLKSVAVLHDVLQ